MGPEIGLRFSKGTEPATKLEIGDLKHGHVCSVLLLLLLNALSKDKLRVGASVSRAAGR